MQLAQTACGVQRLLKCGRWSVVNFVAVHIAHPCGSHASWTLIALLQCRMYLLLAHPGSGRSTLLKVLSGKTQNSALLKVGAPLAADAPSVELQGRCLPCFRAISVRQP